MEHAFQEIQMLLTKQDRPDIQITVLETILDLTGTSDSLRLLCKENNLLVSIASLLKHKNPLFSKSAALILINVSAYDVGPEILLKLKIEDQHVIEDVINNILDRESHIADQCCMILSNITRPVELTALVTQFLLQPTERFDKLIDIFTKTKYNSKGQNLYYLGPVFSNISQCTSGRKYILNKIHNFLPFIEFKPSVIKRGGVVGTLRNCCFDTEHHNELLNDDIDILSRLLLPLAGGDEYDDEENEKLPLELQYLPEDKEREEDPDIRCMLLEALTQLCTLRKNRERIRDKNAYVILRNLHKWEKDKKALLSCENLVDILIRTEEEIGKDNIKDVDVPQDLLEKFERMDREFLSV